VCELFVYIFVCVLCPFKCIKAFNVAHTFWFIFFIFSVHWWGRFPALPEDIFGGGGLPNKSVPAAIQILPELRVGKIRWKQWVMY